MALEEDLRKKVMSKFSSPRSMVALTADAWSCRVYRSYMSISAHWVDKDWKIHSTLLEFDRFSTPQTGEEGPLFLYKVVKKKGLVSCLSSITTHNATDV